MSKNRSLVIISKDISSMSLMKWKTGDVDDFQLQIKSGPIERIKIISKKVVEINFQSASVIFDITESELKKIEWDD